MDIKSIQPLADVAYELDSNRPEPMTVKFTVAFVAEDEIPDYLPAKPDGRRKFKASSLLREMLIDAVRGWDLTMDGKPLECNEENKRKYLPIILGLKIKRKDGAPKGETLDDVLGRALLNFAGDPENFLKN